MSYSDNYYKEEATTDVPLKDKEPTSARALQILKKICCSYLFPFPFTYSKNPNLWTILSLFISIVGGAAILILGLPWTLVDSTLTPYWDVLTTENWIQYVISFLPLYTLLVFLGIPPAREHLKQWLIGFRNLFVPKKVKLAAQEAVDFHGTEEAADPILKNYQWLKYLPISLPVMLTFIAPGIVMFISDAIHHQIGRMFYTSPNTFYWVFILIQSSFAALETITTGSITGIDMLIFLFFFGTLDYRWINTEWYFGATLDFSYNYWAMVYTVVGLAGYLIFRKKPISGAVVAEQETIQYTFWLTLSDIFVLLSCIAGGLLVVAPLGVGIGFIHFPPTKPPTILNLIGTSLENLCQTALTEELFFRGIAYTGIFHKLNELTFGSGTPEGNQDMAEYDEPKEQRKKKIRVFINRLLAMVISSLMFGFMHWPRLPTTIAKLSYVLMASVCGFLICFIYIVSGNNLFAGSVMHMVIDMLWMHVFSFE